MAGPELRQDDEWLKICISVTQSSMQAAQALRATWPRWARWAARYAFPPVKKVMADRRRATEIVRPVLEARRAAALAGDEKRPRFNDGIQWLIEYYEGRKRPLTAEILAQHELFYALASIHGSTIIALSILYDLIDERHQDSRAVIIEEIEEVRKEHPNWTRPAVGKLVKLDSFMKESQRVNITGHGTCCDSSLYPLLP